MGQKQSRHLLAQCISLYLEAHPTVVDSLSGAGGVKRMCMEEQHWSVVASLRVYLSPVYLHLKRRWREVLHPSPVSVAQPT